MWGILFDILVALMQGLIAWEYAYFDFSWFISHHEISKHCLLEFCHHHELPHIFQCWILIFLHSQDKIGSAMALELTESFGGGDMERILGGDNNSVHGD